MSPPTIAARDYPVGATKLTLRMQPIWYHLRASRAQPPGLCAADERRRHIYVAALEQFEELMTASDRVQAASRPLTIYYALAQAGKAIVAAHLPDDPPRRHGLTLPDPSTDLMSTVLKTEEQRGWYQAVSDTVGSPILTAARLEQIWNAIPDLALTPLPGSNSPKAALVVPILDKVFRYVPGSSATASVLFDPLPIDMGQASELLLRYPGLGQITARLSPGLDQIARDNTPNGEGLRVHFSLPKGAQPIAQWAVISQRAPEYRFSEERWLIPAIADGIVLRPLMAWWALLYSLSMLARYHPESWVNALDLNHSPLAVPLEDCLDQAMSAVPHLVLEALLNKPFLQVHRV